MKRMVIWLAVAASQPALTQGVADRAMRREFSYAIVVGHVEAAAKLCMAPADTYRQHVLAARAQLPEVFKRARLKPDVIDELIATGRAQVAGWMPALECVDFVKVVRNLTNWTAAADGWPPAN